jgi:two-component system sensor histidine kinase CpxA
LSRLFVRIWLTFWAGLAATFLAALAFSYAVAVGRAHDIDRLSPRAMAQAGARALTTGGEEGLRLWMLGEHNRYPELTTYVVDPTGRELTGRRPEDVVAALGTARAGSPFPVAVDERAGGQTYRFVFQRTRSLAFDLWDVLLQPWALLSLAVAISGLASALLSRHLTGPIQRLQGGARAMAAGDLASPIGADLTARRDELGTLARDFDHMAGRMRELIAARDAVLRDVSHELRAPLARLRAVSELMRLRAKGADDPMFDRIEGEVERLDELIGQILRFSRLQTAPPLDLQEVDLVGLLEAAVEDARLEALVGDREVRFDPPGRIVATVDGRLLRNAVENILRNAVRFTPAGGAVVACLEAQGGMARIGVSDSGPGVSPQMLPHIFEPFRGEGSGAGLGLAITERVARLHGGSVSAVNRTGGGLEVTLRLPTVVAPAGVS